MSKSLPGAETAIAEHWNSRVKEQRPIRWMNHPWVVRKVNQLVGNVESDVWGDGLMARMWRTCADAIPFRRGISVACGHGLIELGLVKNGLVSSFDCYDFATERIEQGRAKAAQAGLSDRVRYFSTDAFATVTDFGNYDLVFWRNALHHMSDTPAALGWSGSGGSLGMECRSVKWWATLYHPPGGSVASGRHPAKGMMQNAVSEANAIS